MYILFVCSEYPPAPHGGIGTFTQKLAEALLANGYKAAVIGYDENLNQTSTQNEKGVLVRRLAKPTSSFKLRLGSFTFSTDFIRQRIFLSKEINDFIAEIKPDLVESYDWSGPLYSKPTIPLIVRLHGAHSAHAYATGNKKSRILSYFERKNIRFADKLVAVSNHIGNLTLQSLGSTDKSFDTIYNSVDTNTFKPDPGILKDPNRLLFVGRLHPLKGLTQLILCCNELFRMHKQLELDVIGSGNEHYKQQLETLIDPAIKNRIHFRGAVQHHELTFYYNRSALLLLPSQSEAFGITAIEAMACGTPVVMTDKASGPEIITDNHNGLLVDFNNIQEAAKRISELLANNDLYRNIRHQAQETIWQRFSSDAILSQNIKLYESVIR
jgi:glycosyltransferase involved in cell wall biosynthesis